MGTAWQVGFGNLGGIIATYAFLTRDAPEFKTGYSLCLGMLCLGAFSCLLYGVAVVFENRKRDRTPVDVGLSEYEKTEMGVSFPLICLGEDADANEMKGFEPGISLSPLMRWYEYSSLYIS